MPIRKKRRSTEQIVTEVIGMTRQKGWAFRVTGNYRSQYAPPVVKGKHPPQKIGKRDHVEMTCAISGTKMEVVIDRQKDGKIRFKGVDPFEDKGPRYDEIQQLISSSQVEPPEDDRVQVDINKLDDAQRAHLKSLVDVDDREGVIAYLKEVGLLDENAEVPLPQEIQDEDLPDPEELLAIAAQARKQIEEGGDEEAVIAQAVEQAKQVKRMEPDDHVEEQS